MSDRTFCTSALANQVRLILHTAAYWLLWTVRQAIPEAAPIRRAEFTTLQTRVVETAARIRVAFASACPDKTILVETLRRLIDRPAPCQQAP